ncbi:MAG: SRPBCC family protein [Chloroflexi bacterium]|nr:SRPBCC family protein [Chloroflexota bacterium]
MSVIPVQLTPVEVHIHADRRLAFEVITAFGASQGLEGSSSRVLDRENDGSLLVEFHTPATGLLGRRKVYRTVERVTLHEPERVEFEGVEGPLTLLRDRFLLEAEGNCTRLRYESRIGVRGWVAGWLLAWLYARPRLQRLMREHLEEMKEAIEARAARSRVYPQQPCDQENLS